MERVSVVLAIFSSRISARALLRSKPSAAMPPAAEAPSFRKVLRCIEPSKRVRLWPRTLPPMPSLVNETGSKMRPGFTQLTVEDVLLGLALLQDVHRRGLEIFVVVARRRAERGPDAPVGLG